MRRLALLAAVLSCAALAQPMVIANAPLDAPTEPAPTNVDPGGRVRWGIGGGVGMTAPYSAWGLNLEGRVGTQLGSVLAAYLAIGAQFGVGAGIGVQGLGAGAQGSLLGHFTMGALVELLLFHHLSVAAGPAFGLGAMGLGGLNIAVSGGSVSAVTSAGFKPGFDVRLGWGFHSPNPRTHKRRGLNIGVDVLTLFHLNGVVTEVATDFSGTQTTVQKAQTLITVTPMLTLSYESR